jgi:riboflavin synthase alpha subunit
VFTGIVEAKGRVESVRRTRHGMRLALGAPWKVPPGASVSVSGVCLTALEGKGLAFDVVPETLSRTTIGSLRRGAEVNLERAMKAGARLDGHIVLGHVEGRGTVRSRSKTTLEIQAPGELRDSIVPKGSIAVDGVSLTVVDVEDGRFTIALIPTTLRLTTLGSLRRGQAVNLETDPLLKRTKATSGVTLKLLKRAGFV